MFFISILKSRGLQIGSVIFFLGFATAFAQTPTTGRRGPDSEGRPVLYEGDGMLGPSTSSQSIQLRHLVVPGGPVGECMLRSGGDEATCTAFVEGRASMSGQTQAVPQTSGDNISLIASCMEGGGRSQQECECMVLSTKAACSSASFRSAGCQTTDGRQGTKNPAGVCVPNESNPNNPTQAKDQESSPSQDQAALAMCEQAHDEVMKSCDSNEQSWMSDISKLAKTIGPAASQLSSGACGGIAAAASGAEASLATYELMCADATKTCVSACSSPDPATVKILSSCKSEGTKASAAQKQAANAMLTFQSSVAACQAAFGSTSNQAQAFCVTNPEACQMQLAQPIQGKALQSDQAGGAPNPAGLTGGGVGGKVGSGSGFNLSDLGEEESMGIGEIKPSQMGEDIGGAKGGGSVASGGGGQGDGSGGGGGGGSKGGLLSNILSGFFGSGGGGSGGGGLRSWFGGGNKGDAYSSNPSGSRKGGPDLRQFLPGAINDPARNRGIAGQIIGRDGMTGPHSDIWKNINNRYQYKRASLLP